jgi:hypothetical protein
MQFSEIIEALCGLIVGPTKILEGCDQAQVIFKRMKEAEEKIGQAKSLWQIDKCVKSIISNIFKRR